MEEEIKDLNAFTTMIPLYVLESTRAQMADQKEKSDKRWMRLVTFLIVVIILMVGGIILYESQYSVERTTTEYEQDTSGGGSNFIIGGDFHGEAKDQNHDQKTDP